MRSVVTDEETEAERTGRRTPRALVCLVYPLGAGGFARPSGSGTHRGPPFPPRSLEAARASAQRARAPCPGPSVPPTTRPAPLPPRPAPCPEGPAGTRPCRSGACRVRGLPSSMSAAAATPIFAPGENWVSSAAGCARDLRRVGHAPADPGQAGDGALGDPHMHALAAAAASRGSPARRAGPTEPARSPATRRSLCAPFSLPGM